MDVIVGSRLSVPPKEGNNTSDKEATSEVQLKGHNMQMETDRHRFSEQSAVDPLHHKTSLRFSSRSRSDVASQGRPRRSEQTSWTSFHGKAAAAARPPMNPQG